jgi:uncharacterized protein YbdZ (MbtH family)
MADSIKIRSYYAYGRLTIKFIPNAGTEWALVAKKKELPNADTITCKKDSRDDYGAYVTIIWQDGPTKNTIELNTATVVPVDEGRRIYELLVRMGFKPSQQSAKKMR